MWISMSFDYSSSESSKYIDNIIQSVNNQFPKTCNCCGKKYLNFSDFIRNTYIADHIKNNNMQIINFPDYDDIIAFRNCSCHSTMVIKCILEKYEKKLFFDALKKDSIRFKLDEKEIMQHLKSLIFKVVKTNNSIRSTYEDTQSSHLKVQNQVS